MTRRRILVVEDDALLRDSLVSLLEEEGLEVVGAGSGEEALKSAGAHPFDLVVTDVRMPGMDGMSMLGQMRRSSPDTRAVVITGFADYHVPVEAIRLEVDDFLNKPFDDGTFLRSIRRSLESLDRHAWWVRSHDRACQDGVEVVDWVLSEVAATDPEAAARARRTRNLAHRAATALGLPRPEVLGEAARLWCVAGTAVIEQGHRRLKSLCARDSALRSGWEERSLAHLLLQATECALALTRPHSDWLEGAMLKAVLRFDALTHPQDAAIGLSRREGIEALGRDWEGPGSVLQALADAVNAPSESVARAQGAARSGLLGLGLGYLHGGRPDLACSVLSQALDGPGTPARAALALAMACGACGGADQGMAHVEAVLGRSPSLLEEADALAIRGALNIAAASGASETADFDEAIKRYRRGGALRGEVRALLLRAWGWHLRRDRERLTAAARALLDSVEATGLDWVLWRERWLALTVLREVEDPRADRWRERLTNGRSDSRPEPTLVVEILGPSRIRVDGRDIPEQAWKTSKSRSLFLVILLHGGREIPDERLMDLFWDEVEADRARSSLYSGLTYIRRALGGGKDPVIHRRGRCCLNRALSFRVDALEFQESVQIGLARWNQGATREAVVQIEQALELYRGDLLEDCDEDWVLPYRRSCRELAVRALERLMTHHEATSNLIGCVAAGEQLLEIDRCHQGAYQCLMRVASALGQSERAARLYRSCEEALREELHIVPSSRTTALLTELAAEGVTSSPRQG